MAILEFNQCHKSDEMLFITYANFDCLIEKIVGYKSNSDSKSNWRCSIRIFSVYILSFKDIKNNHDLQIGKGWTNKFYGSLRKHTWR